MFFYVLLKKDCNYFLDAVKYTRAQKQSLSAETERSNLCIQTMVRSATQKAASSVKHSMTKMLGLLRLKRKPYIHTLSCIITAVFVSLTRMQANY